MKRAIGVNEFMGRTFITYPFDEAWGASFGEPEKNFIMSVYGLPGNGKTEFCVQLAKYLAQFAKVLYCSYEQGISKSLQDALVRNNMEEVSGRVMFTSGDRTSDLIERLKKRNSAQVVIIDSLDYMRLTTDKFKVLREAFPRKAFVIVSWARNDKPKSQYARDIEFMSDIKLRVHHYTAYPRCRFGGNEPFTVWDKPKKGTTQGQLF